MQTYNSFYVGSRIPVEQELMTPYRRLVSAILYRAYIDFTKKGYKKERALAWINSKDDLDNVQSFVWYCSTLRLCPNSTRKKFLLNSL